MNKIIFTLSFILPLYAFSQVGIGLENETPSAMLDLKGSLRVQVIPKGKETDNVLLTNDDGKVLQISQKDLSKNQAQEVDKISGFDILLNKEIDTSNENERFPTLDLWSEQELFGEEAIKNIYFLGLKQRVTLPMNLTKPGDGKIRKITFVLIKNNEEDGFNPEKVSEGRGNWEITFQTKRYELNSDNIGCVTAHDSYFYKSTGRGTKISGDYVDEGNDKPKRRKLKITNEGNTRDRAIVFFDFEGKWVMSVRD